MPSSPEKKRRYQREYMLRPGKLAEHYARVARYISQNKKIVEEAKKAGCVKCGESHFACLDFHHRDPATKSFTIGRVVNRQMREARLREEIAKCNILCANCHRKLHWKEQSGPYARSN